MSDHAFKRRLLQARKCAAKKLRSTGYGIFTFDDGPFSIIAVRQTEARFIRVAIAPMKQDELKACKDVLMPPGCNREIWTRRGESADFEIRAIQ